MEYTNINGFPDEELFKQIVNVHANIFEETNTITSKAKTKPKLLFTVALEGKKVVGYKLGYEEEPNSFYSWLGGVDENHRNQGVASGLMNRQHMYLKDNGYRIVQTKTKNEWRNMLILNIKSGFNVIGTYTDEQGETKIILTKYL